MNDRTPQLLGVVSLAAVDRLRDALEQDSGAHGPLDPTEAGVPSTKGTLV